MKDVTFEASFAAFWSLKTNEEAFSWGATDADNDGNVEEQQ